MHGHHRASAPRGRDIDADGDSAGLAVAEVRLGVAAGDGEVAGRHREVRAVARARVQRPGGGQQGEVALVLQARLGQAQRGRAGTLKRGDGAVDAPRGAAAISDACPRSWLSSRPRRLLRTAR